MTYASGRHFLQILGPPNIPDRILRAIDQPIIDHCGPRSAAIGNDVIFAYGAATLVGGIVSFLTVCIMWVTGLV